MVLVVVAADAGFLLPYQLTSWLRPTFLVVFRCTNTDIGRARGAYGVTAMLSYLPGGLLADRFSPRQLISASLLLTAAGGLFLATIPGPLGLAAVWAWWGVTATLMLWAAVIKGMHSPGRKAIRWRHPLYVISDYVYKICRVASE